MRPCVFAPNSRITSGGARQKRRAGRFPIHHVAHLEPTLHLAITGASGFLGSQLLPALAGEHRITRLVRRAPGPGELFWDPDGEGLDPAGLSGVDAVIHLAGEGIANGRWTEARKQRIRESRVRGTRLLSQAIAAARGGPHVLVSASAIGLYGERGEEALTESSAPGRGFLPEVAAAWEAATGPAEEAGVRVVRIRIGLLLSPGGGLLQRMLLPFRLGLGGRLGSGRQWMSWIAMDDLLEVFRRSLILPALRGPVNAVAPEPVRNREFTRTLARVLWRPAIIPVPAFALRLLFGQMADELILTSARVVPGALLGVGHQFRFPALEPALRHLLRPTSG